MVVFKFQPHLDKLCANDRAVCQTVSQPCQKATDCQYDAIIRPSAKCELSLQNIINIFWHSTQRDSQKTAFSRLFFALRKLKNYIFGVYLPHIGA